MSKENILKNRLEHVSKWKNVGMKKWPKRLFFVKNQHKFFYTNKPVKKKFLKVKMSANKKFSIKKYLFKK